MRPPCSALVIPEILHPTKTRREVNSNCQNNSSNKMALYGLIAQGTRALLIIIRDVLGGGFIMSPLIPVVRFEPF